MKHTIPTTCETLLAFGISIPLGIAPCRPDGLFDRGVSGALSQHRILPTHPEDRAGTAFHRLARNRLVVARSVLDIHLVLSRFWWPRRLASSRSETTMLRLCRSLRMSEWQVLIRVRFPTSPTFIFSGMKVAVTLAIIGIVVAEFIASQQGLGYLILFASSRQQTGSGAGLHRGFVHRRPRPLWRCRVVREDGDENSTTFADKPRSPRIGNRRTGGIGQNKKTTTGFHKCRLR